MNEGLMILYKEILLKKKSIMSCISGSYNLSGYNDSHTIYIDWENAKTSSVVIFKNDRIAVSMLNGKHKFDTYKFKEIE